jgi:hypothetical protein
MHVELSENLKIRHHSQDLRVNGKIILRDPFEKFVDSPYYPEYELRGGAVTVSLSMYLPWQAIHFLQRSTDTFLRSGWSVVGSGSLAKGGTSKKRPSPHLQKVPTRSNKVSPRTLQTALLELILRKQVGKVCTGFIWLRIGTSVCEF